MKKIILALFCFILSMNLFGCSCSTCENRGLVDCPVDGCSGGVIYCDKCEGKGVLDAYSCYKCDNHSGYNYVKCKNCTLGYITNPFTWEQFRCSVCWGKAYVTEKCEPCNGMGYIGDDCPDCLDGDWSCSVCDGNGTVSCPQCDPENYPSIDTEKPSTNQPSEEAPSEEVPPAEIYPPQYPEEEYPEEEYPEEEYPEEEYPEEEYPEEEYPEG